MSFRARTETNDMQLVTTKSYTVTSRETVLTVSILIGIPADYSLGKSPNPYKIK